MKNIQSLPTLSALVESIPCSQKPILKEIVFVCVQHLVSTTKNLFEALLYLGATPENIFVMGKQYSTSKAVVNQLCNLGIQVHPSSSLDRLGVYAHTFKQDIRKMWGNVQNHLATASCNAIFILDDGGRCLESIPSEIIENFSLFGIEQTSAGFFNPNILSLEIPIIDVAKSAAKSYLEPTIIADEILTELTDHLDKFHKDGLFGIVGTGIIGRAIIKKLQALNFNITTYDPSYEKYNLNIQNSNSLQQLFQEADYIFGCTGRDISKDIDISSLNQDKLLISCSSEDIEFLSLLQYIQQINYENNPLENITQELITGAKIHILKGGFPFNFSTDREVAFPHNIQLTRGLLLGAIIQCIGMSNSSKKQTGRIMLDPLLQKKVVSIFLNNQTSLRNDDVAFSEDVDWIIRHSTGTYTPCSYLKSLFTSL